MGVHVSGATIIFMLRVTQSGTSFTGAFDSEGVTSAGMRTTSASGVIGDIAGDAVSMDLSHGRSFVGSVVDGTVEGVDLILSDPTGTGTFVKVYFRPGSVAEYDQGVAELGLAAPG